MGILPMILGGMERSGNHGQDARATIQATCLANDFKRRSRSMKYAKWATSVATALAALFAAWNLVDEAWQVESLRDAGLILFFWLVLPLLNLSLCYRHKASAIAYFSLCFSFFFMFLYMLYALNGSSADRMGSQHMHLVTVPMGLFLLYGGGYVILRILSR